MTHIAMLATGDEVTSGDILNTNGQIMARALTDAGFKVGMHAIVSDDETALTKAMQFLLQEHDILIITGGLGPTSDDRTRFALSKALDLPLEFSEASWQRITDRITRIGLTIPENNKQQALFPKGAHIYPNPNGTADACYIQHHQHHIFMLPGPPNECLHLFNEQVLPVLLRIRNTPLQKLLRWRLFNVSEGHIAEQLDQLLANTSIIPGYRVDYPYIEFKCPIPADENHDALLQQIETIITQYFLSDPYHKASTMLHDYLTQTHYKLLIIDHATQGLLENLIHSPATHAHIRFQASTDYQPDFIFTITGLNAHWSRDTQTQNTTLTVETQKQQIKIKSETFTLPYRSGRVLHYATEYIADYILKIIAQ